MKKIVLILALVLCSCTLHKATNRLANLAKTAPPTATESPHGIALGQVNIRTCPGTDCSVIGYYQYGAKVKISGDVIFTFAPSYCNRWYPVTWREQSAYVCAAWVSK